MKYDKLIKSLNSFFDVKMLKEHYEIRPMNLRLKNMFDFSLIRLHSKDFVLVKYKMTNFSMVEIVNLIDSILKKDSYHIIFYFDALITQNKKALVKNNISYIIGTKQFYIKELAFNNNDFLDRKINYNDKFSISTQNILIEILSLKENIIYQKDLSIILKEDKVYISRALTELEDKSILKRNMDGNKYYIDIENKMDIWKASKKYFKYPVSKLVYVNENTYLNNLNLFILSGITALSKISFVNSDENVLAIDWNDFKHKFKYDYMPYPFRNSYTVEVWKSNIPRYGGQMNPLAIYLSLMNEVDERVEEYLEIEINKFLQRRR